MRAFQFWILIFGSIFVSGLMIKQIFLSRELNQQQRALVDSQEVITQSAYYESAWQKLAMSIFQASREDPTLAAVLKKENVEVHAKVTPTPGATAPSNAPVPAASSKAPTALPHTPTP